MGSVLRARVSEREGGPVSDRGQDYKMAAGGAWRRPRMKVYDYNQEFGGNYYQPMIQYLNKKDIYGPFHKRTKVHHLAKRQSTTTFQNFPLKKLTTPNWQLSRENTWLCLRLAMMSTTIITKCSAKALPTGT